MKLWNPTKNDLEFKYDRRIYILKPSQKINTHEAMVMHCIRDFKHLGLVVLKDGDDEAIKKREGLLNLYQFYWQQLQDWNSFKDDKRNHGQTILGEYPRVKELRRLIASLEEELSLDRRMEPEIYENLYPKERVREYVPEKRTRRRGRSPMRGDNVNTASASVESQI